MLNQMQILEGNVIVADAIECQHELMFSETCEVPLVLYIYRDEFFAMSITARGCLRLWTANSRGVHCAGRPNSAQ